MPRVKKEKTLKNLTREELDTFVQTCIDKGWMIRTLKPRSPLGKHKKKYI